MAKQTFTVGQVLTAAQLTSLQQTAMGGGAASAKTASYTLVAADAGTTISMTSTSATTITVNTGLFAAGDTVFIQNLGTGNLTITAGSATVASAGSLILPQNDAGILYFVSTGVSVFYDFIQVGAASPLTTKGDLYTFSTSDTRLGVGANGTTLVADSSEATGLKWAAASGAGKVLQVVTATYSTQTTSTSTSFSDTGLTATITPTLNTSKILVMISQPLFVTRLSDQAGGGLALLRGATTIYDLAGTDFYSTMYMRSVGGNTSAELGTVIPIVYLDSPATTSATTYKTQHRVYQATSSANITTSLSSAVASIVLLEIGA